MLDFAIFAVTFLLALVGAVLYLYPVTAVSALGGTRLSPQRLSRPHPNSSGRCGPQGGGPEGGVPAPAPARAGAALGGRDGRGALCARHPS